MNYHVKEIVIKTRPSLRTLLYDFMKTVPFFANGGFTARDFENYYGLAPDRMKAISTLLTKEVQAGILEESGREGKWRVFKLNKGAALKKTRTVHIKEEVEKPVLLLPPPAVPTKTLSDFSNEELIAELQRRLINMEGNNA